MYVILKFINLPCTLCVKVSILTRYIFSFKKQEKYKDAKPSAIDLFNDMHCSKKKGFSENVKKAIVSTRLLLCLF
jgi:hypothetical protein